MRNNELLTMSLPELLWYYQRLQDTRAQEMEFEKLKLEAILASGGFKTTQRMMGG
jgi:hypothetical protein